MGQQYMEKGSMEDHTHGTPYSLDSSGLPFPQMKHPQQSLSIKTHTKTVRESEGEGVNKLQKVLRRRARDNNW